MMPARNPAQSEARLERLVIVEADALQDRIPLLVSSDQRLFAQGRGESIDEFFSRFVKRAKSLPVAHKGLLLLGDDDNFASRFSALLALASRLHGADEPELSISVRSGSASELVGWELLERASQDAFFRGIQLRLQFVAPRAAPAAPALTVRLARPKRAQLSPMNTPKHRATS